MVLTALELMTHNDSAAGRHILEGQVEWKLVLLLTLSFLVIYGWRARGKRLNARDPVGS